ncbi:MAG: type II toxin-antitoxin system VapC family toxin [Chloroflexi bacterium]|nr:type II toxin-antitoxin system VapC family toxin [Chloroflexota bacterium]
MIYLDTHVVVWLYAGLTERLSQQARTLINEQDLLISPMVRLEMHYLYEIGRVTVDSSAITADLAQRIGLRVCNKSFDAIVTRATTLSWTRDSFDRIIVAQAGLGDDLLLSKDQSILKNYPQATW